MITPKDCLTKYGNPMREREGQYLVLWDIPESINKQIPTIPNRIYCNRDLIKPLEQAFVNLIARNLTHELKTWDGCYNIRKQKGGNSLSLHSWGIAVDVNAAWNGLGKEPTLSKQFVDCFKDAGFDWGGDWQRKDGMHFQLAKI